MKRRGKFPKHHIPWIVVVIWVLFLPLLLVSYEKQIHTPVLLKKPSIVRVPTNIPTNSPTPTPVAVYQVKAVSTYDQYGQTATITLFFVSSGGTMTGTVSGACRGTVAGNYTGGSEGTLTGSAPVTCSAYFQQMNGTITLNSAVNLANPTSILYGQAHINNATIPFSTQLRLSK